MRDLKNKTLFIRLIYKRMKLSWKKNEDVSREGEGTAPSDFFSSFLLILTYEVLTVVTIPLYR